MKGLMKLISEDKTASVSLVNARNGTRSRKTIELELVGELKERIVSLTKEMALTVRQILITMRDSAQIDDQKDYIHTR